MQGSTQAFVKVERLVKTFGPLKAVDGVSLEVAEKHTLSLLGPSGCGKTTILRCLGGLERPDAGRIEIAGKTVYDDAKGINLPPEDRQLGIVFQSYAVWPHMSVAENVGFPLKVRKVGKAEARERVARMLDLVGLGAMIDKPATQLSGGQQQRVALARALAPSPAAMLLDEPFASVDVTRRRALREEARRALKAADVVTLVVTHDPVEAMEIADRIAVMEGGRIAQCATPEELYTNPASALVASLFGEAQRFPAVADRGAAVTAYGPVPTENFEDGAPVEVIVRPEAVTLEPARGANDTFRIADIRFLGRDWLILLASESFPSFEPLRARVSDLDGLAVGEAVSVRFDPRGTFIFAV